MDKTTVALRYDMLIAAEPDGSYSATFPQFPMRIITATARSWRAAGTPTRSARHVNSLIGDRVLLPGLP